MHRFCFFFYTLSFYSNSTASLFVGNDQFKQRGGWEGIFAYSPSNVEACCLIDSPTTKNTFPVILKVPKLRIPTLEKIIVGFFECPSG